ncbi:AbfB domain-containing protein [Streptomyces yaizuensis]|uniref:AbfB domain-containing protein n=1 Tax=Streptomyces yaizuensis TaxID=2989713 RepID=A0ABQ5NXA2_9ACTN|nr:AbfB domain-containing protein [Streptomyces sp. YSPA8]GLF94984.1 AbfB domain-containing protein [Streptomyces sp. YSPA8]
MHKRRVLPSAHVRRALTHGIVATTALAALGVAVPVTAVAEPSNAVALAGTIGTTDVQRVDAAAVVRLDPTPDVLLLSDDDFIHALWQKARDAGERLDSVRTAAEDAMASTVADDHVHFITTGIHQAYELDKQRERDRDEADRAARQAKSQALLAIGIPSTPELLALSDDNFVRAIARHAASGPEVRAAAATALTGDAAAWRDFIVNGAREAHQRDVARELEELAERDRKEAERLKELAARNSAAALFRTVPTEAALALADDNFIRELLRVAPADLQGSELYAAAQRAVLSPDPAVWKEFIHTGADAAYKRDDENRRKKIAEANRRLALQIQAAAENGGVHPHLVAAAKKALAGTDEAVADFLKEDTQYRLKRQSFQAADAKLPGWYARQSLADGGEGFLAPVDARNRQADREDATWTVLPSLAGRAGCYSFESVRKPGHYLQADADTLRVRVAADDRSAKFRETATWCARKALIGSGTSFQWGYGKEERWLRHMSGDLFAAQHYDNNANKTPSTWKVSTPLAP